jgi:hypothetical protein
MRIAPLLAPADTLCASFVSPWHKSSSDQFLETLPFVLKVKRIPFCAQIDSWRGALSSTQEAFDAIHKCCQSFLVEKTSLKMEIQLMTTTNAQPISPVKKIPSTRYMHETISLKIIAATRNILRRATAEDDADGGIVRRSVSSADISHNLYKGIVPVKTGTQWFDLAISRARRKRRPGRPHKCNVQSRTVPKPAMSMRTRLPIYLLCRLAFIIRVCTPP